MKRKAVLLDRDGTLNPDPGYISDPANFELFPDTGPQLRRLKDAGFILALVTNQSGIARGLITPEQLSDIHQKLQHLLKAFGVQLAEIFVCPHHPDFPKKGSTTTCSCRKPLPGLALQAIKALKLEKSETYIIGDKLSDIKMGIAAGIKPIAVAPVRPVGLPKKVPFFTSLQRAVDLILSRYEADNSKI